MPNDLIPSSPFDEPAKAVQEASKFGTSLVGAAEKGGGYAATVFGTLSGDIIGMYADRMRQRRWVQYQKLAQERERLLIEWKVEGERDAPIGIESAIFEHALDETREELFSLWARLLAAASDPARQNRIRKSYIDILKYFDPFDAVVYNVISNLILTENENITTHDCVDRLTEKTGLPKTEVSISLKNLRAGHIEVLGEQQKHAENYRGQAYTGSFVVLTDVGAALALILFEHAAPKA